MQDDLFMGLIQKSRPFHQDYEIIQVFNSKNGAA
jgi:hypothetical protein